MKNGLKNIFYSCVLNQYTCLVRFFSDFDHDMAFPKLFRLNAMNRTQLLRFSSRLCKWIKYGSWSQHASTSSDVPCCCGRWYSFPCPNLVLVCTCLTVGAACSWDIPCSPDETGWEQRASTIIRKLSSWLNSLIIVVSFFLSSLHHFLLFTLSSSAPFHFYRNPQ